MRLVVGHSEDPDTAEAVREAVAQVRAGLNGEPPVAALVFVGIDNDDGALVGALQDALPGIPWIGCTSDGEVTSSLDFREDSLAIAVFCGADIQARVGVGAALSDGPEAAVERAVAPLLADGRTPGLCIALSESLTVSAVSVVSELTRRLPADTVLVGGTAGDQWQFESTRQYGGGRVMSDGLVLLALYGDVRVGVGVSSGWVPVGTEGVVTAAQSSRVDTINGEPAIVFYRRHFGDHLQPVVDYPIGVFDDERTEFYLRAPLSFDEDTGSIVFAGDVPVGSRVQLATARREEILDACRASVAEAATRLGGSVGGALIVSCAARKQVLGTKAVAECDILREAVGREAPVIGFYSYGEIAPMGDRTVADFHNETLVTVLFGG